MAAPSGRPGSSRMSANSRRGPRLPSSCRSSVQTFCTLGWLSLRYMVAPSGLKARPFCVTRPSTWGTDKPRASWRYRPPAGWARAMSRTMVPAQKRPWRSQRPSLKRMPSCGCRTAETRVQASVPSSAGRRWNRPVSMPAIRPPSACRAMHARRSGVAQLVSWRSAQRRRRSARPSMSTQYRACSVTDHSGLSPTWSRWSGSSNSMAGVLTRTGRCAQRGHPGR